eukprot:gb/GFBE01061889.1/.p1 GENE.gb/GFBE01061889.1/~~gb/GFBE01061889.1/.p1  ORF type:complete len:395 (+),score=84.28 gb/GFBE01061889.1/:1-1185(+)
MSDRDGGRKRDKRAEKAERLKRREWKRERQARAEQQRGFIGWALALLQSRLSCCAEVVPCGAKDHILTEAERQKQERRERRREEKREQRREERRRRRANKDGQDCGTASQRAAAPPKPRPARRPSQKEADEDSGGSARSSVSRASASSYASSCASDSSYASSHASSRASSKRNGQADVRVPKATQQARLPAPATNGVAVMNLADLQGQDIALEKLQRPPPPAAGHRGADTLPKEDEAPVSARSGRSEGGASMASVASTSIRKRMGNLSGAKRSSSEVKKLVKDFVRQMVKGREMSVLNVDGNLKPVKCGLTRSLDVFRIKSGSETRHLQLKEVENVIHGAAEELSDLATPLDEDCATVELSSAECISFKFSDQEAAELFALCMQLFIDGLRKRG